MLKKEKLLTIVLINTVLAFIIDLIVGFTNYWYFIIVFELPIIAVIYLAMKGKKWAYIITLLYYYIRSFNFYFEDFYLLTKNGLNVEIAINSVAINLVSFCFFIALLYELQNKFDTKPIKIIRVLILIITSIIIVIGLTTTKSEEEQTELNPNSIVVDTPKPLAAMFDDQTTQ